MSIFKKTSSTTTIIKNKINELLDEAEQISEAIGAPEPEEEWIWVEGFKGTDKDMRCMNGYQYELGVQYDIPDGKEVKLCENGFHLCLYLSDVFCYYTIGYGSRFFKVKALVRKSDKDDYRHSGFYGRNNKIAAKSIIFLSELSIDEILSGTDAQDYPSEYKQMAIDVNVNYATQEYQRSILTADGYSMPFVEYIIKQNKFNVAHAVGSQEGVSMDMKVLAIFNGV